MVQRFANIVRGETIAIRKRVTFRIFEREPRNFRMGTQRNSERKPGEGLQIILPEIGFKPISGGGPAPGEPQEWVGLDGFTLAPPQFVTDNVCYFYIRVEVTKRK